MATFAAAKFNGPTAIYIYRPGAIYIYAIYAFRPVCCLLFLVEATNFTLFGGKEEDLRTPKNANLALF